MPVKKTISPAEIEIFDWHRYFSIKKISGGKPNAHSRTWDIKLTRLKFSLSLRRFKTTPATRTRQRNQLVIPIYGLALREIAITGGKRHRSSTSRFQKLLYGSRKLSGLNLTRLALIGLGLVGVVYFTPNVYSQVKLNLKGTPGIISSTTVKPAPTPAMSSSTPVEIQIPSIEVDALIYPVGLQPDGTLIPPSDYTTTGWYNNSPTPGSIGPSVIVGHVDHVGGIGVFWDLRLLQPGDPIDVILADGSVAKFKVDALREYPQSAFPTELVYGNVNYAGLRLITCGGVFSEDTHHYSNNIVVFASLI